MTNQFAATIQVMVDRIDQRSKELAESKRLVNALCREAGQQPLYLEDDNSTGSGAIRPDHFYGKTPIVAAREFLETKNRAMTLEEILDGLGRGGFDFNAQGWTSDLRLRNLGISIGKNTSIFHKLPNGYIGLVKFYPEIEAEKKQQQKRSAAAKEAAAVGAEDNDEGIDPDKAKAASV